MAKKRNRYIIKRDCLRYTACTIIFFQNETGDLVRAAGPWRDEDDKLRATITPSRFDRRQAKIIDEKSIIAFFQVQRLSQVDEILESNFQPRHRQRMP